MEEIANMEIKIRKWWRSDAKDLAAVLSNRNILNNLRDGLPYPYTEDDAADYIEAMLSADENDTFAYAITKDGKVIGSIGAFRQSNIHRQTAELGYYLAEDCWGQGIMTEAIRQVCREIFENTDILRIYAEPFSYNTGSRRALEKAGFRYEGLMRRNAVKNGKVVDMALYSLTRSLQPYSVRRLSLEEIPAALELCWQVFLEFEAPEYSQEGIDAFWASLDDRERTCKLKFYGAFDEDKLVGILCMREPQHIGGFFVSAAYHRRGIGRQLFEAMRQDYDEQTFTVNSSPYAVEVYRRLGFVPTGTEQIENGIRYTPMRFEETRGAIMIESRCGLLCSECEFREQMNCSGCVQIHKPFWGEACPVKSCCEAKEHEHCGQCEAFPCEQLKQFSYDKEQGDDGKRIEQCRRWGK